MCGYILEDVLKKKQVDMSGPPELLRLKLIENYGLHFTSEINTHLKKTKQKKIKKKIKKNFLNKKKKNLKKNCLKIWRPLPPPPVKCKNLRNRHSGALFVPLASINPTVMYNR